MTRKTSVFLFASAMLFFGVSVALGFLCLDFYGKYNRLRLSPLGLPLDEEKPKGHYDFLLIGDSLIRNWEVRGYEVLNEGIGSQTSAQVMYRMALLGDGFSADKAVICVGGNDLKALRLEPDDSGAIVDNAVRNLQRIVDAVRRSCGSVYVMTIPPMGSVPFYLKPLKSTKAMLDSLNEINARIEERYADGSAKVINVERAIGDIPKTEAYAADRAHLSKKAYEEIMKEIM